jgi:hypothetical protein
MKTDEVQREFTIWFNGRPDHRLCVEPDDVYVRRVRGLHQLLREPVPKGQREISKAWARRTGSGR